MTRRRWLWASLALGACRRSAPPPNLFPAAIAAVWLRTSLREVPASEAPDPVPRSSINRLQAADYEGPGKLQARIYQLDSASVALDLWQRWRPSADTVFFYRDQYFVVIKWQDADRAALKNFVDELEKRLGRPKQPS